MKFMLGVFSSACLVLLVVANPTRSVAQEAVRAVSIGDTVRARIDELGVSALQRLRAGELSQAMALLGDATDLAASLDSQENTGLERAAAGWRRRLVQLRPSEQFDLLYQWSMPTESRRTVRVLTSLAPRDAPPKIFARRLGERPRDNSFSIAEVNKVEGLFSTAWLLVNAAEETGRMRKLIAELTELSADGVPRADDVLMLARIAEANAEDAELVQALRRRLAVLERRQPPSITGVGPVPRHQVWQYGYIKVSDAAEESHFMPLPYWTGSRWQGAAQYPDRMADWGWVLLDAVGGQTEKRLSPVRRWVCPADGKLVIAGTFRHAYNKGDGMLAEIVSSRSGSLGEWKVLRGAADTNVQSFDVKAWETIDFVVDCIENNRWDRFHWLVQLTLTTSDGRRQVFSTSGTPMGPTRANTLSQVVLAAACLRHNWLQPFGEGIIKKLLDNDSRDPSPLIRPLLLRANAAAISSRYADASFGKVKTAHPKYWVSAGGMDSVTHAQDASKPIWLAHDDHILHLAGAHNDVLFFRYPLTGEFEFSCETQQNGVAPTDGGLVYGGLEFLAHGGRQAFTVFDADSKQIAAKPCPFVHPAKVATFHRLSIRSEPKGTTLTVNGHPMWTDSADAARSPWIGLRASAEHRPLFRNLAIEGSPVIPREVRLIDGDVLRGWQTSFFRRHSAGLWVGSEAAPLSVQPEAGWRINRGTLYGAKADAATAGNSQSLIRYQRPLLDGESISYEFFYQPGEIEVHPALGRLAFLIEPNGVRLHWLTDGPQDWTGLTIDNAIVEPLNRRGPRPLPLQAEAWNRVTVSWADDTTTLTLNDTKIYERSAEPNMGRQFGFFHDRGRSEARVRNVVMTGNWPEQLPAAMLRNLAATMTPDLSTDENIVLNEIFGEQDLGSNVVAVRGQAESLSDAKRFSYLADWVFAGRGGRSLRLAGAFSRGQFVSPAYDLIEVATRLNRLDELHDLVVAIEPADEYQQRARLALLYLVELARKDESGASQACEELLTLEEKRTDFRFQTLWPAAIVAFQEPRLSKTRAMVTELRSHLLDKLQRGGRTGLDALDRQIVSFAQARQTKSDDEKSKAIRELANWIPASAQTAKTRGQGLPSARWICRGVRVDKQTSHDIDFLYYRIPLTGDFDIECDATSSPTQHAGLMFGGIYHTYSHSEAHEEGTVRSRQQRALATPLAMPGDTVRMRIRVRDRLCTTYINDHEIATRQLARRHEPWLAVVSNGYDLGGVRDLRITGAPIVPDEVALTADPQLLGWLPYFGRHVGAASSGAWRFHAESEGEQGGGIVGVRQPVLAGSYHESLLQYHRPIVEDGAIEYEFYYVPGVVNTHPAVERLAFLLQPDGVKIHWVTDGGYTTNADPTNISIERQHRRGPTLLPLKANAWNRMKVAFNGATVSLNLNSQLIYERPLEATNQRTFGFFHFADQTEVRVRGVVLKSDWPQHVPDVSEQELADKTVPTLEKSSAELAASFSHSFATGGFPTKYFHQPQGSPIVAVLQQDGLFAGARASGNWSRVTVMPRFALQGDYDIEVRFAGLRLQGDLTRAIMLSAAHEAEQRPAYRVLRRDDPIRRKRLSASISLLRDNGTHRFVVPRFESNESHAGRLRLSRRGDTIYFLSASGDSNSFRIIATYQGTEAETAPDGIMLQALCDGVGSVNVLWKEISLRAEEMTFFPPIEGETMRRLVVMNGDGGEVRKVAAPPDGYLSIGSPEWTADGKQIAFDATTGSFSSSHIFVVNADGTDLRDLGTGSMPSYSPDGKRIVYSQPGGGVMVMDVDGANRKPIEHSGWGAQWSPDGEWIAWGRGGSIVAMNVETEERKPLLTPEQAKLYSDTYWNLGWSHDSRFIAFKGRRRTNGQDDLVLIDRESPDGFKVLHADGRSLQADFTFSEDNQHVIFSILDPVTNRPLLHTVPRDGSSAAKVLPGHPEYWKVINVDYSAKTKLFALTGDELPRPVQWPVGEAPSKGGKSPP